MSISFMRKLAFLGLVAAGLIAFGATLSSPANAAKDKPRSDVLAACKHAGPDCEILTDGPGGLIGCSYTSGACFYCNKKKCHGINMTSDPVGNKVGCSIGREYCVYCKGGQCHSVFMLKDPQIRDSSRGKAGNAAPPPSAPIP